MRGAVPALLPRVLLLVSLGGAGGGAARAFTPGADGPVSSARALEGGRAELACDTSLPAERARDRLMLLVWYKNNKPVYSYDARVASEWCSDSFNASGRVSAAGVRDATSVRLSVTRLTPADEALYHCRVDFQLSPTRNSAVNLTVIVLPSVPFFLDEVGNKLEGQVGPYHEGDNLLLSCLVIGGRPPPQVHWYSGDTLLDATDGASEIPGVSENELFLPLAREHAAAPLTCRASNTDLAPPRIATLQLELYVTASSVEMWWESGAEPGGALVAGTRAVAHCRARGAYPQPALSWWLDQHELVASTNQSWDAASRTADSYAEVVATRGLHSAALSCVATNVLLAPARSTTKHTDTLVVLYSPSVEVVKLGDGRANETAEGAPLRLRCEVQANPPVDSLRWYFNSVAIDSGELAPLFGAAALAEGGAALTLAATRRQHAGAYSCGASNARGTARSEELHLAVLYAPECRGVGLSLVGESLSCEVNSLPPPDTYLWRVRGSGELQKITTGAPLLRLSLLQGSLEAPLQAWCEAAGGAGPQRAPCEATLGLRHLRPAPPPPARCDIAYEASAFRVHCPSDGNATYHVLSVWRLSASNASLSLAWRARAEDGGGAVGELRAGDEAGVAACNRYGCSADTLLRPSAALLQAAQPSWWRGIFEKDFGISIGIVVIIVVFIVSSLLVTRALGRFSRPKPPVIQVLQLDDFTARDYLDTLDRKSRSHKSCSSVYSGGSLDTECAPPVERGRKPPPGWLCDHAEECSPDITANLTRESAV